MPRRPNVLIITTHDSGRRRLTPIMQFYDVQDDPLERNNLAAAPACEPALAQMNERFWDWPEGVDAPILRGPVPTPYHRMAMADYRRRTRADQTED